MQAHVEYCQDFDGRAMAAVGRDRFETRPLSPETIKVLATPIPTGEGKGLWQNRGAFSLLNGKKNASCLLKKKFHAFTESIRDNNPALAC